MSGGFGHFGAFVGQHGGNFLLGGLSGSVSNLATLYDEEAGSGEVFVAATFAGIDLVSGGRGSKVRLSASKLKHIVARHFEDGAEYVSGSTSYFNRGEDLLDLIGRTIEHGSKHKNRTSATEYTLDIGRNIGYDRHTGNTSIMTVVVDRMGEVRTAYPGLPTYRSK